MKTRRAFLRRWARAVFLVFLAIVAVLLVRYARSVDWREVVEAIARYDAATLSAAAALALLSYLIYCGYDLAARAYTQHRLSARRVATIAFICYGFSLNLGAAVGSAGLRYRLYSRSGLGLGTIHHIVAFSVVTNWLGYLLLAGILFATQSVAPPADWQIRIPGLQLLGAAMLAVVAAYVIACWRLRGRIFHVRGRHFRLPSLPLAALQLALAATNWSVMGLIVYVLLQQQAAYSTVLGVLLLGAVATALIHIPAGIGVLEAVFVAMLGHAIAEPQLLAALLVYRAFYYLAPLIVATAMYAVFEARGKKDTPAADGNGHGGGNSSL